MPVSRLAWAVVASTLLALVACQPAGAYCLLNETKITLRFEVDPDGFRGGNAPFVTTLRPGQKACCDWRNSRCNHSREAGSALKFTAARPASSGEWICYRKARADANLHLLRHEGHGGCRWQARSADGKASLLDTVINAVLDFFS